MLITLAAAPLLTYSVVKLASESSALKNLNLPDKERLEELEDHYLQARNPNARISSYSLDESERAYETAKTVVDECSRALA
ncbi:MAG: HEPN domain-containing protein [Nitrososphaerales archaeon]